MRYASGVGSAGEQSGSLGAVQDSQAIAKEAWRVIRPATLSIEKKGGICKEGVDR